MNLVLPVERREPAQLETRIAGKLLASHFPALDVEGPVAQTSQGTVVEVVACTRLLPMPVLGFGQGTALHKDQTESTSFVMLLVAQYSMYRYSYSKTLCMSILEETQQFLREHKQIGA